MSEPDPQIDSVVCGDCRSVLAGWSASWADAIVTDPPYGLEFAGEEWNSSWAVGMSDYGLSDGASRRAGPVYGSKRNPCCRRCKKRKRGSKRCECPEPDFDETPAMHSRQLQQWHHTWAREVLRAAKPGAHMLAFGGTRGHHRMCCAIEDAGWEVRDCLMWIYGSGFPKSLDVSNAIGAAEDSQRWEGWGTALKPAWEPIVVARKPLRGTVAQNILRHQTGAINIDGCRSGERWPANVVHDGSAEVVDEFPRSKGVSKSRFFYCAKPSRSEREGNDHPTVKPLALMRWLVRLVCPTGGVVLDPFAGSGSTLVASLMEGVHYLGVEKIAGFCGIAEARIERARQDLILGKAGEVHPRQTSLI